MKSPAGKKMGKLLISHRSTAYPCYVPVLGEFAGAGRIRLARAKIGKKIAVSETDPQVYLS